jgi:hypothetical protein
MKLRQVTECKNKSCPTVYVSDRGTSVAQGTPVTDAEGLTLGPGEVAVELPLDVLKEAFRTLQAEGKL